jgi:K+-transporting ATPase c subunit
MILTSIEKLANDIGFDIGASNDVVQADLLNGFAKGLHDSITQNNQREMQVCYIANKLNNKTAKVLKMIVEFIEIKED